jgi:putative phosphoribosyl transferase
MVVVHETIEVEIGPLRLQGMLGVPPGAEGLVIFAHGSGSGRHSPRNNRVAAALREVGLATLVLDLLTPAEERDRANVFDIALLASRLSLATDWSLAAPETADLAIGYFGAGFAGRGGGVARRASRFGRRCAAQCRRADPADRRRPRHPGHRAEPNGI